MGCFSGRGQDGVKFLHHLLQHIGKMQIFPGQRDGLKIKTGDFKKFIDELFQAVSLIEGDGQILCPLRGGKIRGLVHQIQVADHGG